MCCGLATRFLRTDPPRFGRPSASLAEKRSTSCCISGGIGHPAFSMTSAIPRALKASSPDQDGPPRRSGVSFPQHGVKPNTRSFRLQAYHINIIRYQNAIKNPMIMLLGTEKTPLWAQGNKPPPFGMPHMFVDNPMVQIGHQVWSQLPGKMGDRSYIHGPI